MRMIENLLNLVSYTFLILYIQLSIYSKDHFTGFSIIVPAVIACGVNCFLVRFEETPCNSTIQLANKVVSVLRLLIAISAFVKIDSKVEWDWSTTFWPYWCSFAIQAIMAVASLIIFANTIMNYYKEEALIEDSKLTILFLLTMCSLYSMGYTLGFRVNFWVCDVHICTHR